MLTLVSALGLLLVVGAVDPACAAGDEPAASRIPTVTRTVKIFTELESAISSGVQRRDAAALQKMLSEDFELRVGALPGNPTPRAQWIDGVLSEPFAPTRIEQMAVHDLGNIAVVSFLASAAVAGKHDPGKDVFVVDVWKRAADTWQLAIRYASAAGGRPVAIPGDASSTPRIPKKY